MWFYYSQVWGVDRECQGSSSGFALGGGNKGSSRFAS